MTKKSNVNALTHGAFCQAVFLPEEDPDEFDELHLSLIEEWEPDGPTEEDKVLSVAINMWRKRRVREWRQNNIDDVGKRTFLLGHMHGLYEIKAPIHFVKDFQSGALKDITEENISTKVGAFWASQLKIAVPRSQFQSDESWLWGISDYIIAAKVRNLPAFAGLPDVQEHYSRQSFADHELDLEERIDAKIAKDLKELGQIKTMKAIGLGKRRASAFVEDVKVVQSPAIVAEACKSSVQNANSESLSTDDTKED